MAWFKVDDGFYTSQKVLMIPRQYRHEAIGAWVITGTWSADNMTDGIVPNFVLSELGVSDDAIHWLCTVGLWIPDEDDGITFHDWCDYQPTKADLQAKHEAKVAAGKAGGKASGEARRSRNEAPASDDVKQQSSTTEANANPEPEPVPNIKDMYSEAAQSPYSDDFERWWKTYPRRHQKGDAWKAWQQLRKQKLLPTVDELITASKAYESRVTDPQFLKLPGGWLRAHSWNDEPQQTKPKDYNPADYSRIKGWGFRYENQQ